ncbi:DUF484 family protein [Stutzerimonas tarimensis]|uniref:DUF484 family protein n=1 Tax=Stutzerimonas tarimensis TaxID=1507735 RepID=A0ABV7T9R1_9GAMM
MSEKTKALLDAESVAAWLEQHPRFFMERDELLTTLQIPHGPNGAVSLVERQISLLRERNNEMRGRLAHLMDVARDNDRLFDKTRRLILDVLEASNLEEVVGAVDDSLRHRFQVPYVSLILFSDTPLPVGRSVTLAEAQKALGGLLSGDKSACGTLRPQELSFLFGEDDGQIGSAAVASIGNQGMLAVGSPDPQHYKSTLGTLFLTHITEVLSRVLPRFNAPLRSVR